MHKDVLVHDAENIDESPMQWEMVLSLDKKIKQGLIDDFHRISYTNVPFVCQEAYSDAS